MFDWGLKPTAPFRSPYATSVLYVSCNGKATVSRFVTVQRRAEMYAYILAAHDWFDWQQH